MINCNELASLMAPINTCKVTPNGTRISTTCLYPSFEVAHVLVRKFGDGFVVSDEGEGVSIAVAHGQVSSVADKVFSSFAKRFGLQFQNTVLSVKIESSDWLLSAILSVSNASTQACCRASEEARPIVIEDAKMALYDRLHYSKPGMELIKEYEARGESGRRYNVDVAMIQGENRLFFEFVSSHKNSVNSKYVMFSDVGRDEKSDNVAVYVDDLDSADQILLQSVADVAPFNGVENSILIRKFV